jgi:cobalt-zinc-cadmium efflux system protein
MNVATAHLATTTKADSPAVLEAASETLSARFGIAHATLQIESPDQTCHGASW